MLQTAQICARAAALRDAEAREVQVQVAPEGTQPGVQPAELPGEHWLDVEAAMQAAQQAASGASRVAGVHMLEASTRLGLGGGLRLLRAPAPVDVGLVFGASMVMHFG